MFSAEFILRCRKASFFVCEHEKFIRKENVRLILDERFGVDINVITECNGME